MIRSALTTCFAFLGALVCTQGVSFDPVSFDGLSFGVGFGSLVSESFASDGMGFDGIRITLLGTGGPLPAPGRSGPATLVEAGNQVLLFDCGRGVGERLAQAGVGVEELTAIFVTNLDEDHTEGCAGLQPRDGGRAGTDALLLFGPEGTTDTLRNPAQEHAFIDARDIAENLVYQTDEVSVTAFIVEHGGVRPAYGYRVDYAGRRSIAISGDTRYSENLIRNAHGVQVLVHEVAAADAGLLERSEAARKMIENHTTPEAAARVFREARPYLAVYSHILLLDVSEEQLMRRTHSGYRGALQLGQDMMVIEIQNEVQVRAAPSEPRSPRD
jgi:ribonuclease Z